MSVRKIQFTLLCTALFTVPSALSSNMSDDIIAKGKYLVSIGGCNDCHTAGYAPSGGAVPEAQWLLGDQLGYRGPWGTTYAINLREYVNDLSEEQWISKAKELKTRPPMPWWILNTMTEKDLSAVYQYVKSLGMVETSVPEFVPPSETPSMPYIQWPQPPE